MRFTSGTRLWAHVEAVVGRRLTTERRARIDPDNEFGLPADYDASDYEKLLGLVRAFLIVDQPGRPERLRARARERVAREAELVRDLVEGQRAAIWGAPTPPFRDAAVAAQWIESQQDPPTTRVTLSVDLPGNLAIDLDALAALHRWLRRQLKSPHARESFAGFLEHAQGLHTVSIAPFGILPFLPPTAATSDSFGVMRVDVSAGSILARVLTAAEEIAAQTTWELVATVHHLLTGGLMAGAIRTEYTRTATSSGVFRNSLTLEVADPLRVDQDAVREAFVAGRKRLPGTPKRARLQPSTREDLKQFVDEHPGTWRSRRQTWNRDHPDALFPSDDAMRKAYSRNRGGSDN